MTSRRKMLKNILIHGVVIPLLVMVLGKGDMCRKRPYDATISTFGIITV